MNDAQFLNRQMVLAKAAMAQTALELKRNLAGTVDARNWLKQYPWVSVGSGLVLGFLGGAKLAPRGDESLKEKWAELSQEVRALGKKVRASRADENRKNGARADSTRAGGKAGLLSALIAAALKLALKLVMKAMAEPSQERVVRIVNAPPDQAGGA